MKKRKFWFTLIICGCIIPTITNSCGKSGGDVMRLVEERDSLQRQAEMQSEALENFNQTFEIINATLDSIARQNDMIFVSNGETTTRENVLNNLSRYEEILNQQKEKIKLLEEKLAKSNPDSITESSRLLAHLNAQIAQKNAEIAHLKEELSAKNVDISRLRSKIQSQQTTLASQNVTINELSKTSQRQNEALARQDALLNEGYVMIATKGELKRSGVIKKGKLAVDALTPTKFDRVDIRTWKEYTFNGKKPKILTNMPSSSYELKQIDKNNYLLKILNPAEFWKISNYLVIQQD